MEKQCKIKKYIRDSNRLIKKKEIKKSEKHLIIIFTEGSQLDLSAWTIFTASLFCYMKIVVNTNPSSDNLMKLNELRAK